jgi:thymidylate synthase ThyX
MTDALSKFAPLFQADAYTEEERYNLEPFFSNLDQPVYATYIISPELVGALLARTSRANGDLRMIFLKEFINPFLYPVRDKKKDTKETWQEKLRFAKELKSFINYLHKHSILDLFSNPRAREFYIKWLAGFGDDSIAQLAGMHVIFTGLSQTTIKHFEDMRLGIGWIEKSTRYISYVIKTDGKYLYYVDPVLSDLGLQDEYIEVMDNLFDTYAALLPELQIAFTNKYPDEKASVIEKKAFDTLRLLLPCSTLSQVALFTNAQAAEYLINRSLKHHSGEIRWAATRMQEELSKMAPSFFRRLEDESAGKYQEYLASKGQRTKEQVVKHLPTPDKYYLVGSDSQVVLLDYDTEGENKVITAMLYDSPGNHLDWQNILDSVRAMTTEAKIEIINAYFKGRVVKWMKVGRALENAFARFEITLNIGAWRDLHRHRPLTQQRQSFSTHHGYDVPQELIDLKLDTTYRQALDRLKELFDKLEALDPILAQHATALANRLRFMMNLNLRSAFWLCELRTIPEGHPDYRIVAQAMYLKLKEVYPLLAEHMLVNMNDYVFARRGQEEAAQKKLEELQRHNDSIKH